MRHMTSDASLYSVNVTGFAKGPHPAKLTFPVRSFVAGDVDLGRSSDFLTNR